MLFRCAAGTVAVLFVLAGCGSSDSQSEPSPTGSASSTPTPTPSGASPSTPTDRAGTCLGPKPGKPSTKQPVACTQPHDLEIAAPLSPKASSFAAAGAEAEQACRTAGATYLGSPHHASTRLRVNAAMPTEQAWAKGQRHASCLVEIKRADLQSMVTVRGSIRNALAGEGLHRYRLCGLGKASASRFQYTDCTRPHQSEALPIGVILATATDPYPGREALNRQIGPQCRTALREFLDITDHRRDIVATWRMPTQTQWSNGSRTATCFAQVDSPLRKSLRALAHRPLR